MPRISIVFRIALRATRFALLSGLVGAGLGTLAGVSELRAQALPSYDAPVQRRPVVNGHRVPPRPSDFNGPEFTPEQSKKVDELYLQLLRMRASEAAEAERVLKGRKD
jgi:hypothetical protein